MAASRRALLSRGLSVLEGQALMSQGVCYRSIAAVKRPLVESHEGSGISLHSMRSSAGQASAGGGSEFAVPSSTLLRSNGSHQHKHQVTHTDSFLSQAQACANVHSWRPARWQSPQRNLNRGSFQPLLNSRDNQGSEAAREAACLSRQGDYNQLMRRPHPRMVNAREFWGVSAASKTHRESRVLGYSQEQLYSVVADVARYKEFLPWCVGSKILWQRGNVMEAELEIGFQLLKESYTSRVTLNKPHSVLSTVGTSMLFDHLNNRWEFKPGPVPGTTHLFFAVDFQFKSALYQQVSDLFFTEVVCCLVSSFEQRCAQLYGPARRIQMMQSA